MVYFSRAKVERVIFTVVMVASDVSQIAIRSYFVPRACFIGRRSYFTIKDAVQTMVLLCLCGKAF